MAPMEVRMEVLRAGRWVAPMEVLRVVRMVVQKEAPMEGRSVVPMGVRMVVQKEAPMEGRSVAPMVVQKEVPRVGRTGECLEGSGRMAEPVEVLLRLQVGVVGVKQRFPLRVRVGLRVVLPEVRARTVRA